MASMAPKRRQFTSTLRRIFLQTFILLVISLLLINWYLLCNVGSWNPKVTLERKEKHGKAAVDKDIQMLEKMPPYRDLLSTPNSSRHSKTLNSACPKLSLGSANTVEYGLCTPHKPSEHSCEFANKMYSIKPKLSKCKKKGMGEICEMKVNYASERRMIYFACNKSICNQGESDSFNVICINPKTGLTEIVKEFSTVEKLERGLPAIARKNNENKSNFMFVECKNHQGEQISQFIPLEPRFTVGENKNARNRNLVNVNVLLIDSVSRAHFYRSLPRTVSTFKKWRENPRAVPAKVFDFELFQALHGHTAVNMHAFYTGQLFPVEQKEKTPPLNISALFGHYKRAGFHTVWQEDLCWKGIWGLMSDLGVNSWGRLQEEMKSAYIDHTGKFLNGTVPCVNPKFMISIPWIMAPVVQRVNNFIQRRSHYPADKMY